MTPGVALPGEQVFFDANAEAEGHDYFSLGALSVSHDGQWLAYSTDVKGDERYTLRIKNLSTGELLPDTIENISAGATWSLDARYVFYQTVDDAWRPDSVWRHEVGSSEADVQVFHEPDERYWVGIGSTQSDEYLVIGVGSKITAEAYVLRADDPTGSSSAWRAAPRASSTRWSTRGSRARTGSSSCTTTRGAMARRRSTSLSTSSPSRTSRLVAS